MAYAWNGGFADESKQAKAVGDTELDTHISRFGHHFVAFLGDARTTGARNG